ncbi:hypothetical protein B0920_04445 [Massilia sp. KIM]|nr:hypothetical protein B0920_04445 [Massilia sp. KIM]
MMWLRALYQARQMRLEILALQAEYPIDQAAPMANSLTRGSLEGVKRLIKRWLNLVNLPNFKKQTPLMLAAREGTPRWPSCCWAPAPTLRIETCTARQPRIWCWLPTLQPA